MVKDIDLPYLETKVVKGRVYNYFRKGLVRIPLPRNKNSREFNDKYWEARTGKSKAIVKTTVAKTIELYKKLKKSTKTNYERHFKDIIKKMVTKIFVR